MGGLPIGGGHFLPSYEQWTGGVLNSWVEQREENSQGKVTGRKPSMMGGGGVWVGVQPETLKAPVCSWTNPPWGLDYLGPSG